MKKNKFLIEHALHLATALAVVALILIIPATATKKTGLGVFFYILAALLLVGGGVVLYLAHSSKVSGKNYFLYDAKKGIQLPREKLSFPLVREGTERFLGEQIQDVCALWQEIPTSLRERLKQAPQWRPLIAYRMLWELSEMEGGDIPSVFGNAGERALGFVCNAIRANGDEEMAAFLLDLKKKATPSGKRISAFFTRNKGFFEARMLRYAEQHLHAFDTYGEE